MRILSIDFDYFINTDIETRNDLFPDGYDNLYEEFLKRLWTEFYLEHPQLKDIDVIDSYNDLVKHMQDRNYVLDKNLFVASSHGDINKILKDIPTEEPIDIVNVDFHHDYYHVFSSDNELNCGNWVRRLYEKRSDANITWVRRHDSDVRTLDGEFPHKIIIEDIASILTKEYDIMFLCLSPEWTPPHLYKFFYSLTSIL